MIARSVCCEATTRGGASAIPYPYPATPPWVHVTGSWAARQREGLVARPGGARPTYHRGRLRFGGASSCRSPRATLLSSPANLRSGCYRLPILDLVGDRAHSYASVKRASPKGDGRQPNDRDRQPKAPIQHSLRLPPTSPCSGSSPDHRAATLARTKSLSRSSRSCGLNRRPPRLRFSRSVTYGFGLYRTDATHTTGRSNHGRGSGFRSS